MTSSLLLVTVLIVSGCVMFTIDVVGNMYWSFFAAITNDLQSCILQEDSLVLYSEEPVSSFTVIRFLPITVGLLFVVLLVHMHV